MKCPHCHKDLWLAQTRCPFCHADLPATQRPTRPWTVSLVCWCYFAIGVLALVVLLLPPPTPAAAEWLRQFRLKQPFQYYGLFIMPALLAGSALFMLRGNNLARWFFVIWFGNATFWQVLKNPMPSLPGALLFLIGALILFLPAANSFFRPPKLVQSAPTPPASA